MILIKKGDPTKAVIANAGALGFCGLYCPPEVGGMGLSRLDAYNDNDEPRRWYLPSLRWGEKVTIPVLDRPKAESILPPPPGPEVPRATVQNKAPNLKNWHRPFAVNLKVLQLGHFGSFQKC